MKFDRAARLKDSCVEIYTPYYLYGRGTRVKLFHGNVRSIQLNNIDTAKKIVDCINAVNEGESIVYICKLREELMRSIQEDDHEILQKNTPFILTEIFYVWSRAMYVFSKTSPVVSNLGMLGFVLASLTWVENCKEAAAANLSVGTDRLNAAAAIQSVISSPMMETLLGALEKKGRDRKIPQDSFYYALLKVMNSYRLPIAHYCTQYKKVSPIQYMTLWSALTGDQVIKPESVIKCIAMYDFMTQITFEVEYPVCPSMAPTTYMDHKSACSVGPPSILSYIERRPPSKSSNKIPLPI